MDDRFERCVHEAGHVAAAHALSLNPDRVSVASGSGFSSYDRADDPRDRAIVAAAGCEAVRMVRAGELFVPEPVEPVSDADEPQDQQGAGADDDQDDEDDDIAARPSAFDRFVDRVAKSDDDLIDAYCDEPPAHVPDNYGYHDFLAARANLRRRRIERAAGDLLVRHAPRVRAVAHALYAEESLGPDRLAALLNPQATAKLRAAKGRSIRFGRGTATITAG